MSTARTRDQSKSTIARRVESAPSGMGSAGFTAIAPAPHSAGSRSCPRNPLRPLMASNPQAPCLDRQCNSGATKVLSLVCIFFTCPCHRRAKRGAVSYYPRNPPCNACRLCHIKT